MSLSYPLPAQELDRLRVLEEHDLIGSSPEESFDDLTVLAAEICEAPIALITLLQEDRQWIKSRYGIGLEETARSISFCTHAICQPDVFIVPDALQDERFVHNPLVTQEPSIRFYAGMPLHSRDGHAVGTLCVLDTVPRELTAYQKRALRVLSRHVCTQLELRRAETLRSRAEEELARTNAELERRVELRTGQLLASTAEAQAAKRLVSSMVERMSEGIVALDRNWRFDYVTQKASELLGLCPSELLKKDLLELFPEGPASPVVQMCQRSSTEQKPGRIEAFYEPKKAWFEYRCYPSEEGLSIFFQDVSIRREAEANLSREKELSQAIIASLPGTFYFFDEKGEYLAWNPEAERVSGVPAAEFGRLHPLEKVAPVDRQRVADAIEQVFQTGDGSVEARMMHVSGEQRWHLLTGRRLIVEGKRCLVGIGVDISDRKTAEEALEEARSRLELAVSASDIGLWVWEVAKDTIYFSPQFKRQLGYEDHEFPNEHSSWQSHLHPDDLGSVHEYLLNYMEQGGANYEQEYRMRHRDGTYRWMYSRAQLMRDADGRPERLLGCHIDITSRRLTEEALRKSREQLRALGEHQNRVREDEAARIARELHDELGAALTGLKIDVGWIDRRLTQSGCDGSGQMRERISAIDKQLDETISSVREVCHALRPGVLDQLGLAAAIEGLCAEFQARSRVECTLQRDERFDLPEIKSIAVYRILQELLTNVSRHAQASEVSVEAYCAQGDFHLVVSDNGVGLPADALARMDRFGLAGVRERAFAANGTVQFEQRPGGGTTVSVCLPAICEEKV